jgi:hypothetical protein
MRSTTSWHVLVLARSSGTDSTTTTKALPATVAVVLATVPSRRVRVGSIGSALNAAKLMAALLLVALVCGEKGEEGDAVLVSRCERRVVADGVRTRGGGLRFVGSCVETCLQDAASTGTQLCGLVLCGDAATTDSVMGVR